MSGEKPLAERDEKTADIINKVALLGTPAEIRTCAEGVLLGVLSCLGYEQTVKAFEDLHRRGFTHSGRDGNE